MDNAVVFRENCSKALRRWAEGKSLTQLATEGPSTLYSLVDSVVPGNRDVQLAILGDDPSIMSIEIDIEITTAGDAITAALAYEAAELMLYELNQLIEESE